MNEIERVSIEIKGNEFAKDSINQLILNDHKYKIAIVSFEEFKGLLETLYMLGDIEDYKISQK